TFAVQVLLEYVELSAHPRFADLVVERRDRLDDESLHPQTQQQARERGVQRGRIVTLENAQHIALDRGPGRVAAGPYALLGQRVQSLQRVPDELAGSQAGVHQTLDGAQTRELVRGVLALGVLVAFGPRKAVAPLPDAQHVLRKACFALDRAY